jgi:hypothetical protein
MAERPGATTVPAQAFVLGNRTAPTAWGARWLDSSTTRAARPRLGVGLRRLDPVYAEGTRQVTRHRSRPKNHTPLLDDVFVAHPGLQGSPGTGPVLADRLEREPVPSHAGSPSGFDRTIAVDAERTWQVMRRAAGRAGNWICVDRLLGRTRGVLLERHRWSELAAHVRSFDGSAARQLRHRADAVRAARWRTGRRSPGAAWRSSDRSSATRNPTLEGPRLGPDRRHRGPRGGRCVLSS